MKSFSLPSTSSSPRPLTSSPPPYSPTTRSQTRHRRLQTLIHWSFIGLSLLTFTFSIAIITCTASSLQTYHNTDLPQEWSLQLWPSQLDLRPTRALLSCGVIIATSSLAYLLTTLLPSLRKLHALILATLLAFVGLFVAIFALAFDGALNNVDGAAPTGAVAGTMQSWTCNFQAFATIAPMGFVQVCRESNAAVVMVIILLALEAFAVGLAGVGWWVELKGKSDRGEGAEEVKMGEFA